MSPEAHDLPEAAGILPRTAAYVVDAAVFSLVTVAFTFLVPYDHLSPGAERFGELWGVNRPWTAAMIAMCFAPAWLYLAAFEASIRRATPGKRLLRLQVIGPYGQTTSFVRALVRNALKLVPTIAALIALHGREAHAAEFPQKSQIGGMFLVYALVGLYVASAMMTRRKQSLHDLAAGTCVILTPRG